MNSGQDSFYKRRGPREVATVAAAEDRGPRQSEAAISDPFDQAGQAVIEGRSKPRAGCWCGLCRARVLP